MSTCSIVLVAITQELEAYVDEQFARAGAVSFGDKTANLQV